MGVFPGPGSSVSNSNQPLRKRILVVEDEPELLRAITLRLTTAGYEVFTASDGYTATDQAWKIRPDLIVLDLGLPGLSGHGVASRLRVNGRSPFPIIILSARSDMEDRALAGQLDAAAYLVKPYQPKQLLSVIQSV